eukprot:3637239-Pleurochrysis_carterae.AAC.1
MELVSEAHSTLLEMKANMRGIQAVLKKWSDTPLIVRRAAKTYVPDVFMEEHTQQLEGRYREITDGNKEIHRLLLESNKVLKVSKGAPAWRAYVEFINNILVSGIATTVVASLQSLLRLVDPAELA